jgi:hypothetical protein
VAIQDKIKDKLSQKRWLAYQEVFSLENPNARVVMKDLCAAHHVFDIGFDPDPIELARMAGERNVVLRILTLLKAKPEDIIDLAKEGA